MDIEAEQSLLSQLATVFACQESREYFCTGEWILSKFRAPSTINATTARIKEAAVASHCVMFGSVMFPCMSLARPVWFLRCGQSIIAITCEGSEKEPQLEVYFLGPEVTIEVVYMFVAIMNEVQKSVEFSNLIANSANSTYKGVAIERSKIGQTKKIQRGSKTYNGILELFELLTDPRTEAFQTIQSWIKKQERKKLLDLFVQKPKKAKHIHAYSRSAV